MSKSLSQGDIVHLQFDPAVGKEMKGPHFALIVSQTVFNKKFGLTIVCPISQGGAHSARSGGFTVSLMGAGTATLGMIHCHQVKSLDLRAREARFVESVPGYVLDEVLARIVPIFTEG